ncbi:MAG: hypothetical protein WC761_01430 [Candidatus Paceibacterota bacterium]|jgi:hypothetical protein
MTTAKAQKSFDYYRKMRSSNPALFKTLARQAKLAIEAMKKEKTPAETAELLKILLAKDKEMDPRLAPDTYGVRLFIDAMLTNTDERSKTKRYYINVLDAMLDRNKQKMTTSQKLTKEELKKIVAEAAYGEMLSITKEQLQLAENLGSYLEGLHFLKEYKELDSKAKLFEFFGPFKKLSGSDISSMADKGGNKRVAQKLKVAEVQRKKLTAVNLNNVSGIENALETFVDSLVELYKEVSSTEGVDEKLKAQAKKLFGFGAYTIQSMQSALARAASDLFMKVPRSSGMYSDTEATDFQARAKSFMQTPGQALGAMGSRALAGAGGASGGRFSR